MSASLSGTIAGDLFVFGDIRDVVRERQAPRDGRGYRSADTLALAAAGSRGDRGGDLLSPSAAWRRCARRSHAGSRMPARSGAGRGGSTQMGRPFGAPDRRRADACRMRLRPVRCCGRGQTVDCDKGRLPAPRRPARWFRLAKGRRACQREGRHARRAGYAEDSRGARRTLLAAGRTACGIQGADKTRANPQSAGPRRLAAGGPAPSI